MSQANKNNQNPAANSETSDPEMSDSESRQANGDPAGKPVGPRTRKRPPRDSFWLGKRNVLLWVLAAAVLLTIYAYLEQNVFALNRPLIWQDFSIEKTEQAEREGVIVTLLVGQFHSPNDISDQVKLIDIPPVRKEAHRQRTLFSVVKLEKPDSKEQPNRDWIKKMKLELPWEEIELPVILVVYKKSEGTKIIPLQGNPSGILQKTLNEIRRR